MRVQCRASLSHLNTIRPDADAIQIHYRNQAGARFLQWYGARLVDHGDAVLSRARAAFGPHEKVRWNDATCLLIMDRAYCSKNENRATPIIQRQVDGPQ
jgi:hypothetical protein